MRRRRLLSDLIGVGAIASDVSVSNACAVTSDGVQVFYRDESQGILLGAVKQGNEWIYEIVDGEKDTEDRTTGDVGFHLKASVKQDQIHLIYDSVKGFDAERNITRGEIRYATRNSASSLDWKYRNLDLPSDRIYAAGYDVGIYNSSKGVEVGWFTASGSLFPNPDSLKYQELNSLTPKSVQPNSHGTPNSLISIDSKSILFSCEQRLCALNKSNNTTTLISKESIQKGGKSEWITVNKIRYAIAGVSGKLTLFKS